jgi:hypothetical protein
VAVAYGAASTIVYSTGNPAATYPASITRGDLLILLVGTKPDTSASTRPVGDFVYLGAYAGGGGTTGADTGPTLIEVFWKIATGAETGTQTVTNTGNSVSWVQMYRFTNSTKFWSLAIAGGTDSTTGTAWSVTCDVNPGITSGDMILVGSCTPTDIAVGAQFTAESVSATGATLGSMVEVSEPQSSSGNDIGGFVFYMSCSAGTSSAAPVITATAGSTTTNVRGPSALIRIREASSQREVDSFTLSADGATLEFADEVTDLGGSNGTGTWTYERAFAENTTWYGSKIDCTTSSAFIRPIWLPTDLTSCWFTIRFKYDTLPTAVSTLMQILSTSTLRADLRVQADAILRMRNNSVAVGSGIGPIVAGETYYLSWNTVNGTAQSMYLYDSNGFLLASEVGQTFNAGTYNKFSFGLVNAPGLALVLHISRPGYDTNVEIGPTVVPGYDPTFEANNSVHDTIWSQQPAGYSYATTNTRDTAQSHAGSASMKVAWPACASAAASTCHGFVTTPGHRYQVKMWVRVPTGDPSVALYDPFATTSGLTYTRLATGATKDSFVQLDISFTASVALTYIGVAAEATTVSGDFCNIDDVEFAEIVTSTIGYFGIPIAA